MVVNGIQNTIKIKNHGKVRVVDLYGISNKLIVRGKVSEVNISGMNNKVINHKKFEKLNSNNRENSRGLGESDRQNLT